MNASTSRSSRVLLFSATVVGALGLVAVPMEAASAARVRQVSARDLTTTFAADAGVQGIRASERAFLVKAVETSRQQLRLAEVGVGQAGNSDVRSHALQMVGDYRALSDMLDALIRRRGGIGDAPVGATSETYRSLIEKSGNNFDREFVRTVAQLSSATLSLFEQVVSESRDSDVRELAAAQLPVLRAHRSSIKELEKAVE